MIRIWFKPSCPADINTEGSESAVFWSVCFKGSDVAYYLEITHLEKDLCVHKVETFFLLMNQMVILLIELLLWMRGSCIIFFTPCAFQTAGLIISGLDMTQGSSNDIWYGYWCNWIMGL